MLPLPRYDPRQRGWYKTILGLYEGTAVKAWSSIFRDSTLSATQAHRDVNYSYPSQDHSMALCSTLLSIKGGFEGVGCTAMLLNEIDVVFQEVLEGVDPTSILAYMRETSTDRVVVAWAPEPGPSSSLSLELERPRRGTQGRLHLREERGLSARRRRARPAIRATLRSVPNATQLWDPFFVGSKPPALFNEALEHPNALIRRSAQYLEDTGLWNATGYFYHAGYYYDVRPIEHSGLVWSLVVVQEVRCPKEYYSVLDEGVFFGTCQMRRAGSLSLSLSTRAPDVGPSRSNTSPGGGAREGEERERRSRAGAREIATSGPRVSVGRQSPPGPSS